MKIKQKEKTAKQVKAEEDRKFELLQRSAESDGDSSDSSWFRAFKRANVSKEQMEGNLDDARAIKTEYDRQQQLKDFGK